MLLGISGLIQRLCFWLLLFVFLDGHDGSVLSLIWVSITGWMHVSFGLFLLLL